MCEDTLMRERECIGIGIVSCVTGNVGEGVESRALLASLALG